MLLQWLIYFSLHIVSDFTTDRVSDTKIEDSFGDFAHILPSVVDLPVVILNNAD